MQLTHIAATSLANNIDIKFHFLREKVMVEVFKCCRATEVKVLLLKWSEQM